MRLLLLLCWASISSMCCLVQCVRWSSPVGLIERLVKYEGKLLRHLYGLAKQAEETLQDAKSVIEKMEAEAREIEDKFLEHFDQPVKQLQLMKRYGSEWKRLESLARQASGFAENILINITRAKKAFPKPRDQDAAHHTLLRLQEFYNLNTKDLALGKVGNTRAKKPLTSAESARMAKIALRNGNRQLCREWNHNARLKLNTTDRRFMHKSRLIRNLVNCSVTNAFLSEKKEQKLAKQLCNNETPTHHHRPDLTCHIWTNHRKPSLLLRPVKMEILCNRPRIVRFYDVMTDDEIAAAINKAKPLLGKGYVMGEVTDETNVDDPRIAHATWIAENETYAFVDGVEKGKSLNSVSKRIEAITGLDISNSQTMQLSHYGVGGRFSFHTDFFPAGSEAELSEGNRIATFLIYLTDVPYGGHTVFQHPKISVNPIKGSAVFWYNLHPNGDGDETTVHAGCPIAVGSKWIAVKWIHDGDGGFCRVKKYFDGWTPNL